MTVSNVGNRRTQLATEGQSAANLPPNYQKFHDAIMRAAEKYRVPASVLFGILSRETNGQLINGDGGHGRGPWQIDDRSHASWLSSHDAMNIDQSTDYAASILRSSIDAKGGDLRAGIAAYNCGPGNVRPPAYDARTTGGNYSADVLRRAEEFKRALGGEDVQFDSTPMPGVTASGGGGSVGGGTASSGSGGTTSSGYSAPMAAPTSIPSSSDSAVSALSEQSFQYWLQMMWLFLPVNIEDNEELAAFLKSKGIDPKGLTAAKAKSDPKIAQAVNEFLKMKLKGASGNRQDVLFQAVSQLGDPSNRAGLNPKKSTTVGDRPELAQEMGLSAEMMKRSRVLDFPVEIPS